MSIGPMQLLIILAIVLLVFGTKKLRNLGEDLGGAIKGFKKGMKDGAEDKPEQLSASSTLDGEAREKKD